MESFKAIEETTPSRQQKGYWIKTETAKEIKKFAYSRGVSQSKALDFIIAEWLWLKEHQPEPTKDYSPYIEEMKGYVSDVYLNTRRLVRLIEDWEKSYNKEQK